MTSEQLNALERLARAATPGPRRVANIAQVRGSRRFTVPSRRECEVVLAHVPGVGVVLVEPPGGQAPSADAQLMAALDRETVLALIARVRELEGMQRLLLRKRAGEGVGGVDE